MRQILIACFALMLCMMSCKKNYSCKCTTKGIYYFDMDGDGIAEAIPYTNTILYKIEQANRTQAKVACNEATIKSQYDLITEETTCELTK